MLPCEAQTKSRLSRPTFPAPQIHSTSARLGPQEVARVVPARSHIMSDQTLAALHCRETYVKPCFPLFPFDNTLSSMANAIEKLDNQLSLLLADWGGFTTFLAIAIVAFVAYPIIYPNEPDTHPLLLARQSSVNPVRNKNESALYRSPEVPHGYPLKTGLNVKDEGAPRWNGGKDGDIRDVWRVARRGGENGEKGRIVTVLGKEEVIEHDKEELSKEIEILGKHLKARGVKNVAIYLPNSIEFLSAIFGQSYPHSPITRALTNCMQHAHSTA